MQIFHLLRIRIKHIVAFTVAFFCAITLYLFHLQITQTSFFARLSRQNFLRQENIASPRGNITDIHGTLLATNRPVYSLFWQGTGKKQLIPEQQNIISQLSFLCPLTDKLLKMIPLAEKRSEKLKLAVDLSFEMFTQLTEQLAHQKNIILEKTFKRCYPHNELACHVLGYLGLEGGSSGKMGLESICNKKLRGQPGKMMKIMNSIGRRLGAHQVQQASAGETLQTTLDFSLQKCAEELFPQEYQGCCIVMDDDGALEVVLSRPAFEPNLFLKPLSVNDWQKLQEDNRFMNRALSACYPPASLFKLITLAAALESGIISSSMCWHCIGHTSFKGRAYHCKKREGHGVLSTKDALAHSCNIPFYEIGKKIKIDTIAQYAHIFGLGRKTGVLFSEKTGLIPTNAWKKRVKKEPWWPGETLSVVIGQGPVDVTPLQIACMISGMWTGWRIQPRILADEAIVREPLEISKDTLSFLQYCLTAVVSHGTGALLKRLHHFTISGKSGTAQVQSLDKKVLSKKQLPHGYFAVRFQYKNEKPRTLVIILEHAASSTPAIRFAYQFLKNYATYVDSGKHTVVPPNTI